MHRSAAAFFPQLTGYLSRDEMLQRPEKIGPKTSAMRIGPCKRSALEDSREKLVCQLARLIFPAPFTPQKSDHRRVVCRAEVAERLAPFAGIVLCSKDPRPLRRREVGSVLVRGCFVQSGGVLLDWLLAPGLESKEIRNRRFSGRIFEVLESLAV